MSSCPQIVCEIGRKLESPMCVCVLNRDTHHFWPLKHYTKPYRNYKKWHINISFTHAEHALWALCPSVFAGLQQQPIYYVKSPISLLWEVRISGVCLGPFLSECGHAFVCVRYWKEVGFLNEHRAALSLEEKKKGQADPKTCSEKDREERDVVSEVKLLEEAFKD